MARSQNSKTETDARAATNSDFARYLEAENPNCPASELSERFEAAKAATGPRVSIREAVKKRLDRLRADYSCSRCGSSDVFYTRRLCVAKCDRCGIEIAETDKDASQVMAEW